MISVGRNDSPCRYACVRDQWSATRPAATYAVAKAQVRMTWAERSVGADDELAQAESTDHSASDVAMTTARSSSRSS